MPVERHYLNDLSGISKNLNGRESPCVFEKNSQEEIVLLVIALLRKCGWEKTTTHTFIGGLYEISWDTHKEFVLRVSCPNRQILADTVEIARGSLIDLLEIRRNRDIFLQVFGHGEDAPLEDCMIYLPKRENTNKGEELL